MEFVAVLFVVLFLPFASGFVDEGTPAQVHSTCLSYTDETTLVGGITEKTFPGPPNYEDITKGDAVEHDLFITLSAPVCVDADIRNKISDNIAIAKTTTIQLAADGEVVRNLAKMVGHKAKISGKLFGMFTGHHHTPVLIFVNTASINE